MTGCSVAGCDRPHYAKTLCNSHWARSRRGHDMNRPFNRKDWPFAERLWARTDKAGPDDCWIWRGSSTKGYGVISVRGKQSYAHRIAYELTNGPIAARQVICHRCDTPLCVNPAHLFAGSNLDNARDAVAKGRHAHGERQGCAKLKNADIGPIRERLLTQTAAEIAAEYGVSRPAISLIGTGKTWRGVA